MTLPWLFAILISFCVSETVAAASVTEWGSARPKVTNKVVGKWQLVGIYEGSTRIHPDEVIRDYWIFKDNGWVEHYEEPEGLRRSSYWMEGRKLTVRARNGSETRSFLVTYVDKERMIWKVREAGRTLTYNFARY